VNAALPRDARARASFGIVKLFVGRAGTRETNHLRALARDRANITSHRREGKAQEMDDRRLEAARRADTLRASAPTFGYTGRRGGLADVRFSAGVGLPASTGVSNSPSPKHSS